MTLPTSMLVAVDGSEPAVTASAFAGTLAAKLDASVVVATVVPERLIVAPSWVETMAQVESNAAAHLKLAMNAGREIAQASAVEIEQKGVERVEWTVEVGDPVTAIVSLSERYGADAIVMGRRGTGNIKGLLLGSVSAKVSHLSDLTVATVRTTEGGAIGQLLVAVDGSEHSDRAAVFAAEMAVAYGAALTIINVVQTPVVPILIAPQDEMHIWSEGRDVLEDAAEEIVSAAAQRAEDLGVEQVSTVVKVGHPSSTIVDFAAGTGADVICIGRRGLGNVSGILLGSVSHAVGHLAEQTVITVR